MCIRDRALGEALACRSHSGDILALVGDLGAGKTTLSQGIMRALGYDKEVTSPTFSLVQEYLGGRMDVFHFDFYRVESERELLDLGWDDYVERKGLIIVEWPTLFSKLLPLHTKWLHLSHSAGGRRVEEIHPPRENE